MILKIQFMHLLLPCWIFVVHYYRDAQIIQWKASSWSKRSLDSDGFFSLPAIKSRIVFIVLLLTYEVLCSHIHYKSLILLKVSSCYNVGFPCCCCLLGVRSWVSVKCLKTTLIFNRHYINKDELTCLSNQIYHYRHFKLWCSVKLILTVIEQLLTVLWVLLLMVSDVQLLELYWQKLGLRVGVNLSAARCKQSA